MDTTNLCFAVHTGDQITYHQIDDLPHDVANDLVEFLKQICYAVDSESSSYWDSYELLIPYVTGSIIDFINEYMGIMGNDLIDIEESIEEDHIRILIDWFLEIHRVELIDPVSADDAFYEISDITLKN